MWSRAFIWSAFHALIRLVLAAVLVAAAVPKLMDPGAFAQVVGAYGLVPHALDLPLAVGLPLVELVVAVGLVVGARWAIGAAALLFAAFMAVLGWGIHLGLDVDCGCFGAGDPRGEGLHGLRTAMIRDFWLLVGCGYLQLFKVFHSRLASGQFRREVPATRSI